MDQPSEDQCTIVASTGRRIVERARVPVVPRDFRRPTLLAEGDLRRLRNHHTEFARHFSAKFSAVLKLEFTLTLSRVETAMYGAFADALPDPAHLTVFKIEPLGGLGVINVAPALGLAITNRMLGGKGKSGAVAQPLTEIETVLLEDFLRLIVEEWCRQWEDLPEPRPILVAHETSGKFLQTSSREEQMLVATMEAKLGAQAAEVLQIALPFAALEKSIRHARRAPSSSEADRGGAPDQLLAAWRSVPPGVSVPATASWRLSDISLRDASRLRAGDILELPNAVLTRTRISLPGATLFVGTAGVRDGRIAVRLDHRFREGEHESHEPALDFALAPLAD